MASRRTAVIRENRRDRMRYPSYTVLPLDGTAVRQPDYVLPEEEPEVQRRPAVSARTRRNRSRALAMSRGYVLFLTVMSILTVCMCVYYLRLLETVTSQLESNARLESQLRTLTSENDALYETITNSVDMELIRETAINELGMTYAGEDQIIRYHTDDSGYVRQYRDVPDGD